MLFSCEYSENKKIARMVSYWQNHEIIYPKDRCISRKGIIHVVDFISQGTVPFFVFQSKKSNDLIHFLDKNRALLSLVY